MPKAIDSELTLGQRRAQLSRTCKLLAGHGHEHPAAEFERVAAWCREQDLAADAYGTGVFLQEFESKVARLLGFEAARFMPSGTLAQPIALRLWAEREGCNQVGLHPTCHLELHEHRGYEYVHALQATMVGDACSPMLAKDLHVTPEQLSALVVELPTRENGGQLPTWAELNELVQCAKDRGSRLHLDGARLWEAQAAYDRPFPEICAGFDSAYVSFYKGIGALPGAMLLGPRDFIDEAAIWQRRQGGNLYSNLVHAASAAMRLDSQIAKMPSFRTRALELGSLITQVSGVRLLPDPPQVNMFHLLFDAAPEMIALARDQVAEETGLWIVGGLREGEEPNTSRSEASVFEAALELDDEEVLTAFRRLIELAKSKKSD